MNWHQIEGNWKHFKEKIKEKWTKLTDQDLDTIHGDKNNLAAKLREKYGMEESEVDRELDNFQNETTVGDEDIDDDFNETRKQ